MEADRVLKLLREAYDRFHDGDQSGYDAALEQAKAHIGSGEDERWLLGEWKLVASLAFFRDPGKLIRLFDEIIADLGGRRSQVLEPCAGFLFGSDSVFWTVMREPGRADRTGVLFGRMLDRYQIITGFGQGYLEFYKAELAYQRGELAQARALAYQAVYMALNTNQSRLAISAAMQVGHVALHMRDMHDWTFATNTVAAILGEERNEKHMRAQRSIAHVAYAQMLLRLGDLEAVPDWIKEGRFGASMGDCVLNLKFRVNDPHIVACDYPVALWEHALYLMSSRQCVRALAADAVQRMFGIEKEFVCYQLYYSLLRGLCYRFMGERERAKAEFSSAVELAMPDGLWLTIAEFAPTSDGLVFEAVRNCGGDVNAVRRLAAGFQDNKQKIKEAVTRKDVERMLTAREREIAQLAARGLRNKEIAEKLSITEQTVKFHLSNTYSKLDIDNRAKLAAVLKNTTPKLY